MAKDGNTITAAMAKQFAWTTEELAEELGMNLNTFRVWKNKMEKEKKITKPAIPSMYCIKDPDNGLRLRYSDSYLAKLKEAREGSPRRAKRGSKNVGYQHAILKLNIPVFDEVVAEFLKNKFKDSEGIEKYLKDHLHQISAPAISRIDEIKRKFEEDMRNALTFNN